MDDYLRNIEKQIPQNDDVVGYAVAVNGKVDSVDVFASPKLFGKMKGKLLKASATEAVASKTDKAAPAPDASAAAADLPLEDVIEIRKAAADLRGFVTQAGGELKPVLLELERTLAELRMVTEGIADYVRWFVFEPEDRRPQIHDLDKASYKDSYQTTAAFFAWIVEKKDKKFIQKLNAECRKGKYKPELFKKYAGKPLDDLWKEFIKLQKEQREEK